MQRQEKKGLKIIEMAPGLVEVFFDFSSLPTIDIAQERFVLEVAPRGERQPTEWVTPNGPGPLFLNLRSGQTYDFNLYSCPHPAFEVKDSYNGSVEVQAFFEHPQLYRLVWSGLDVYPLKEKSQHQASLKVDGQELKQLWLDAETESFIPNRAQEVELTCPGGVIFRGSSNLKDLTLVCDLEFQSTPLAPQLGLAPCVSTERSFQVRSILTPYHQIESWIRDQAKKQGHKDPNHLVGGLQFIEDGKEGPLQRIWGYALELDENLIEEIQIHDLREEKPQKPKAYRLELQLTSAHRECYRKRLIEREWDHFEGIVNLAPEDIKEAQDALFAFDPLIRWEESFIELVGFFKHQDYWQEMTRQTAWLHRWEHHPGPDVEQVQTKLVTWDLKKPGKTQEILTSPIAYRDHFPPKLALKPFSDHQILVWWDLEYHEVNQTIQETWGCDLNEVGFYLKVHEEYLGSRKPRPDLDSRIINLFTPWQNLYLTCQPDQCYSAEIVARHFEKELALTPVSGSIVTPKGEGEFPGEGAPIRHFSSHWHHPTQREVRHQNGSDRDNKAKVLFHLHMHSPNLFRAEQFREPYLKARPWPIRTPNGDEVHNPPGEWALKNCFDSWLPLLKCFHKLAQEGLDYQVSLDITPPVAYMISHPRFKDYFARYLLRIEEHAKAILAGMKSKLEAPELIWAAQKYLDRIMEISHFWRVDLQQDMIQCFRDLQNKGFLELSTCTATHGMPANLETTPDALDAQVAQAVSSHERIFGSKPAGIWLAENSCFPGVEKVIAKWGLHYYFVEAEAVLSGSHRPPAEEHHPLLSPINEVVAFGRSRMGRIQVWDAEVGYAGHPDFREYHHRHWGLPLKRITSKTSWQKAPYNADWGEGRAKELAQDFYQKLKGQAQGLGQADLPHQALITCTYDAELYGHHWYEGPWFLEELLREFYRNSSEVGLTTPSRYLAEHPNLPVSRPNPSTWGHEAQHSRWNDPEVAWVQREIERADGILSHYLGLCQKGELQSPFVDYVNQMARELLRAESSDLTFVIISGDFVEDMRREILKFLDYFYQLKGLIDNRLENEPFFMFRRLENDMFPDISDYYDLHIDE